MNKENLLVNIWKSRKLIFSLAKNDFKTRFAGSYLGIVWAFIQPIITVLVYWFVFQVGLRAGRTADFPFVVWLVAGLVPWFFFSEAISGGTNALIEYSYLVKKVVFNISILPIVKLVSAMFVNFFFIVIAIVLCWVYGYSPDFYTLQILYYMLCMFLLVIGIVYITSAIAVFFRDVSQIIGIILQVGIWATPIMWDAADVLPPWLHTIFKINPVYYVVDGFRDACLVKAVFWDKPFWTLYVWALIFVLFLIGSTVFKKLKVHFADVL